MRKLLAGWFTVWETTGAELNKEQSIYKPIVLLGGGHAHVEVVRRLCDIGNQIILVSPSRHAPYSGMLPGFVSGQYSFEDLHIDLARLCADCGVTFIEAAAIAIDPDEKLVRLTDDRVVGYSVLSIDIGSTPLMPTGVRQGIPVKPVSKFIRRLEANDARAADGMGTLRLAVVGQGVAGVEMAFALQHRLGRKCVEVLLVGRAVDVLAERSGLARWMVKRELMRAGIAHHANFDVIDFKAGFLFAKDGRSLQADDVVWTTSGAAPAWLKQTGLTLDDAGFIRVDSTLRSLSHSDVFASGDIASLPHPRPKAGVFAVREGPVLAANICRSLSGATLRNFRPQKRWLVLISLSDGRAIADKWGLAVLGRWVALLKYWNDTRFVSRYRR